MIRTFEGHMKSSLNKPRSALAVVEVLVAASLIVSIIGVMSTLVARSKRVQQSTRQYQIASQELANQLDVLTRTDAASLANALNAIRPTESIARSLPDVQLTGRLLDDSDGKRVELSISWSRNVAGAVAQPLRMVAWVPNANRGARQTSQTSEANAP
jgi:Tfp pilus assembly protein PilV